MKIFITGATGFIGTHLVLLLREQEHKLVCLVRNSSRNTQVLKQGKCRLVYGDVTDKASIVQGMRGCDWVVNLANVYSLWEPDPSLYQKVNVEGTRNVMEASLEARVRKIVHVSTVTIFGKPDQSPITEETVPAPFRVSTYAETKYQGEKIVWDLYRKKGLPVVVVYPAAVLGPGDTKATGQYIRLLAERKMPAVAFPNATLTFVHVKDVAEAIWKVLEKKNNIGEKYLVGNEKLTMGEFNELIAQTFCVKTPRLVLPDWMAFMSASLLTKLANLNKKPPLWGLALDQARTMHTGFCMDGSKVCRELSLSYRKAKDALKEMSAEL